MKNIGDILKAKQIKRDHRNSYEFQAYGNKLADDLGDGKHRSLYLKLAKTEKRAHLEEAKAYVMSSENATTKGRLFMWKLKQIKLEHANKIKVVNSDVSN